VEIPENDRERIAALIHSDASPVGIDAKKTHVLILHKLEMLERRLAAIEARLAPAASGD
jgi:hypothetical protein